MFINRKYKDSVFTDLFGSDRDGKKKFLELYNALSGSDYKLKEVTLERKVIEQSLYKTYNNSERVYKIPNPEFYVVYVGKKELPAKQELKLSDAFYKKDGSNLELVVKVRNCTNPDILPIEKDCAILKQYSQFIQIVENTYNKKHPKSSFKKAIETAISKDILTGYLDRKSREVFNMLCAKYDYKMDIAVKKEEAFAEGKEVANAEAAKLLIEKYNIPVEQACADLGISPELLKNHDSE